jgi:tetratricopeptide (TPR) repeat protein
VLDLLVRAHLIEQAGPGRYGLHDLLRAYARDLAAAEDTEQQRHAALGRLFDHYLHTAGAAMDLLFPAEAGRRPRIPSPPAPTVSVTDQATARAWLDAERANLAAAAAYGSPGYTPRLAAILSRYLDSGGHYPEAVAIHGHASRAARLSGDRAAEANSLTSLGLVHFRQGRYRKAASHLQQALALSRQTGNLTSQARALSNLALVEFQRACWPQGVDHLQQARAALLATLGSST